MVGFPLLLIPLAIYNIIVLLMQDVSFTDPLLRFKLMSGAEWDISLADMLLALGVLCLLLEVVKGARPGAKYLTDHLLSLIIFGAAVAEFLLWPKFGTSTYCLLTMMSAADFLSGVAQRARRSTLAAPPVAASRGAAREAEPVEPHIAPEPEKPAVEPQFAPPPAPVPSAASIAESVLMDRPEPKSPPARETTQAEPSPSIASPELQPATTPPPSPEAPQR
jgi:hypothetical protein